MVVAARRQSFVDGLADEITATGASALAVALDVTHEDGPQQLISATAGRFGRLDALVYNAFVTGPMAPAADCRPQDWRDPFEVNVVGAVRMATAAVPHLSVAPQGGAIVLVNSQAARRSAPRRGPYAASKAALLSVARTLSGELGPQGIRVNSVVPGHIWGEALEGFFTGLAQRRGTTPEAVYESVAKETDLRRLPTPEEIADAIVFLASPLARAITGQSLDVNAGNWYE